MSEEQRGSRGPAKDNQGLMKDTIRQLKDDGVQFGLNSLLEPVVFMPDDPFQKYWPADSQRFMVHLSAVFYDQSGGRFLKPSDRELLRDLLLQECYTGQRQLTEVEAEETERVPVVQAILAFFNRKEEFEGMTADLLKELWKDDIQRQLTKCGDFPLMTNIFSRQLKRLSPILRGYGIEVVIHHEEDGSHSKLTRSGGFQREPDASPAESSGSSSGGSQGEARGTGAPDDTDARNGSCDSCHPYRPDSQQPQGKQIKLVPVFTKCEDRRSL